MESILLLIFCGTIILSLILILFYIHYVIKGFVLRRNVRSSFSSTSNSRELQDMHKNSNIKIPTDAEESETTESTIILMIPQEDQYCSKNDGDKSRPRKKHGGNQKSNFFGLPLKQEDSYHKFNSVDELEELEELKEVKKHDQTLTRQAAYFARKGRRNIHRKCTWENSAIVRMLTNNRNNDAENYKSANSPSSPANNRSVYIMPNDISNLKQADAIDKEVLI